MSRPRRYNRTGPAAGLPLKIAKDAHGREYTYVDMGGRERDGVRVVERLGPGASNGSRWRLACSACGRDDVIKSTARLLRSKYWRRWCCGIGRRYTDRLLGKEPIHGLEVLDVVQRRGQPIARCRCVKCGMRFRTHARHIGNIKSHPKCPGCSGGRSRV